MRASKPRSHHSSSPAPGVKLPLIAMPCEASAASAISTSPRATPTTSASRATVTGPAPSRRERTRSTIASLRTSVLAYSAGTAMRGFMVADGCTASACGKRSAATSQRSEGVTVSHVARWSFTSLSASTDHPVPRATSRREEALAHERVVQLVAGVGGRPRFLADALDGGKVELAQVGGGLGVEPAPCHDRLRASLLERRVVEVRVRSSRSGPRARAAKVSACRARRLRWRLTRSRAGAPRSRRCPWLRAGSRRSSGARAGGRESRDRRRCCRRTRPGRGTPTP